MIMNDFLQRKMSQSFFFFQEKFKFYKKEEVPVRLLVGEKEED